MENIHSQTEIIEGLKQAFVACTRAIENTPDEVWAFRPDGKWSAGQNLDHLIKSTKPLNMALGLPKFALKAQFGKPNDRPVKTYEQLKDRYYERLADVPPGTTPGDGFAVSEETQDKAKLIEEWKKAVRKCVELVSKKWSDKDLEKCLLPHPLLGKLFVREILFFTIFHTIHHTKTIEERNTQFEQAT